jgi:ribosomal protein S6 kinase alpha-5
VRNSDRKEFAVKIVSRRVDCAQEVAMLARCQGHPNIVKLEEIIQASQLHMSQFCGWHIQ